MAQEDSSGLRGQLFKVKDTRWSLARYEGAHQPSRSSLSEKAVHVTWSLKLKFSQLFLKIPKFCLKFKNFKNPTNSRASEDHADLSVKNFFRKFSAKILIGNWNISRIQIFFRQVSKTISHKFLTNDEKFLKFFLSNFSSFSDNLWAKNFDLFESKK